MLPSHVNQPNTASTALVMASVSAQPAELEVKGAAGAGGAGVQAAGWGDRPVAPGGGGGVKADVVGEAIGTSSGGQLLCVGAATTFLQYGQATDCPAQVSSISIG